jgi:hypothetical protein
MFRDIEFDQLRRRINQVKGIDMRRVVYSMDQSLCLFDVRHKKTIWEWEMVETIKKFYFMYEDITGALFVIISLIKETGAILIHDPFDGQVISRIVMKPER